MENTLEQKLRQSIQHQIELSASNIEVYARMLRKFIDSKFGIKYLPYGEQSVLDCLIRMTLGLSKIVYKEDKKYKNYSRCTNCFSTNHADIFVVQQYLYKESHAPHAVKYALIRGRQLKKYTLRPKFKKIG